MKQLPVLLPRVQFTSVRFPQFGGQYSYYIDKEEEIHLQGQRLNVSLHLTQALTILLIVFKCLFLTTMAARMGT